MVWTREGEGGVDEGWCGGRVRREGEEEGGCGGGRVRRRRESVREGGCVGGRVCSCSYSTNYSELHDCLTCDGARGERQCTSEALWGTSEALWGTSEALWATSEALWGTSEALWATSEALGCTHGGGGVAVVQRGIFVGIGRGRRGGLVWVWNTVEHGESLHQHLRDEVPSIRED